MKVEILFFLLCSQLKKFVRRVKRERLRSHIFYIWLMFCNRILGTTHHGTYKKVVDVPLLREELTARSVRCIARDGVEIEMELYEDLQEGDIVAETEQNVYAIKVFVPKKREEAEVPRMNKSYLRF